MGAWRRLALLGLLLASSPSFAESPDPPPSEQAVPGIRSGLPLEVQLLGDQRYEGAFVGLEDQRLLLSTREGVVELPLPALVAVTIEGQRYSPEAFLEGTRRWGRQLIESSARVPPPVLVAGASVLWAGAGPAVLGDWKGFAAYSLLEASFIGAGAVMISNDQYGPLLPLAALDVLLHVWAGSEGVRESKRRRSRARLAVTPLWFPGDGAEHPPTFGLAVGPAGGGAGIAPVSGPCRELALTGPCPFP
jgi:hypothetical protein